MVLHPVLASMETIEAALKDVADVEPTFMRHQDKLTALLGVSGAIDRLEELRLRVLAASEDVAEAEGARDAAAVLAQHGRRDRVETRRRLRLACALSTRWGGVAGAMREGAVNLAQAEVIVAALEALPAGLDPEMVAKAQEQLVAEAAHFGPLALRVLGRRVLAVVAPEIGEEEERRQLEREAQDAERRTFFTLRRNGDGTTDVKGRLSDLNAQRLLTYLSAFTSPRREAEAAPSDDRRPYSERLGHAFAAFLEAVEPARLPLHGGDATTVFVAIDLETLRQGVGGTALAGDEPITAAEARRLACNARILPAVLGGDSEILDLGRSRRLFSRPQRRALAVRHPTCAEQGCDMLAAWCEAHHAGKPWADGGLTDLAEAMLLCSFHHHRAHDQRYEMRRLPDGGVRFHRRT